jgi:SAM-dependent methyltransferase
MASIRSLIRNLRGGPRSVGDLHEYWRDPPDEGNRAESYLGAGTEARSRFLVELAGSYVDRDARVLEVGCNVGRNLEALREAGFANLNAVEISARALELLRERHPELAAQATLHNRSVEDFARELRDGEYDLIYTMAVMEHIHPDSEWVFAELARATAGALITVEDERAVTWRHFPRDYREVFEARGLEQVEERTLTAAEDLDGFQARVFRPSPR